MTAKIHAGWGRSMGQLFCGRHFDKVARATLDPRAVTCQGCLRVMLRDRRKAIVEIHLQLRQHVDELVEIERQVGYLRRKSGVDVQI